MGEETGIERFGSNSLVDGLGSMLVIGICIAIVILLTLVLRLIASRSERVMKLYIMIKTKMMYNALLRYVL